MDNTKANKYTIQEINDKGMWEDFLGNSSGQECSPTSFIQSWNWGEFSKKMGQKIYRLGIYQNTNAGTTMVGIALGILIKAKRGKYLHFRHGPVINWKDQELVKFVLDYFEKLAKTEGASFVRISPLITYSQVKQLPELMKRSKTSQMHNVDSEETWILDLNKTEEELLANMRKNTRYSIRKAEKMGVKIIKTKDSKYLDEFWNIMMDTVKRQKWTFYSKEYIKNEFEIFAQDDKALLFLASYNNKLIAGSMFIYDHNQSAYHHSGALTEFRNVPASYMIQWEAIKEAKARGLKRHNFWGLPLTKNNQLDMHDPWTGVGLFKVGFGGHAERWAHARDIPVSWKYWTTHYYEKFETFKRNLLNRSN